MRFSAKMTIAALAMITSCGVDLEESPPATIQFPNYEHFYQKGHSCMDVSQEYMDENPQFDYKTGQCPRTINGSANLMAQCYWTLYGGAIKYYYTPQESSHQTLEDAQKECDLFSGEFQPN